MNRELILKFFFGAIVSVWMIPMLVLFTSGTENKSLVGAVVEHPDTSFSKELWFTNEYQSVKEKYLEQNLGLSSIFIKSNNQLLYSLFGAINPSDVSFGEGEFLFEKKNILAAKGFDFMGDDMIICKTKMLKLIQDTIEKQGKFFCVLHAPNKVTYMPENVHEKLEKTFTNIKSSVHYETEYGIHFLDVNEVFKKNKTNQYPLFPVAGTHWSVFGMHVGLDAILNYFEQKTNKKQVKLDFTKCHMSMPVNPDSDLSDLMNIWLPLTSVKCAYPMLKVDSVNTEKLKFIIFSDSFWMGLDPIVRKFQIFKSHEFFYYNFTYRNIEGNLEPVALQASDLKKYIERNDVISIMSADAQLPTLGWGFLENAFQLYYPNHALSKKLESCKIDYQTRTRIMNDPVWRKSMERQAKEQHKTFEAMLIETIEWLKKV
jgi:SGNH hydrolase-like domain, acetyltransferase AlgX